MNISDIAFVLTEVEFLFWLYALGKHAFSDYSMSVMWVIVLLQSKFNNFDIMEVLILYLLVFLPKMLQMVNKFN